MAITETHDDSKSNPLWIAEIAVGRGVGRIGITFAPGKMQFDSLTGPHDRDLDADLARVAAWGATAAVTLMEAHELARVRIPAIGAEGRARHIEWHHTPIVDVTAPGPALETGWPALSARLHGLLARGPHPHLLSRRPRPMGRPLPMFPVHCLRRVLDAMNVESA